MIGAAYTNGKINMYNTMRTISLAMLFLSFCKLHFKIV